MQVRCYVLAGSFIRMCARVHTQTGEVLPRFYTKFRLIESRVAFGKEITLEVVSFESSFPLPVVPQDPTNACMKRRN